MISVSKRRAVSAGLTPYCPFAKESDFIEVTNFTNGEGYDICISRGNTQQTVSLTHGELELLQVLIGFKEE